MRKDAAEVVGDVAHDEAVEQGDAAFAAGAGEDAAGREKPKILQRLVEWLLPSFRLRLGLRQRAGDTTPAVLDRAVDRRPVGDLQAVFRIPDLPRDRCDAVRDRSRGRLDHHVHRGHPSRIAPYDAVIDVRCAVRGRPGQRRRGIWPRRERTRRTLAAEAPMRQVPCPVIRPIASAVRVARWWYPGRRVAPNGDVPRPKGTAPRSQPRTRSSPRNPYQDGASAA